MKYFLTALIAANLLLSTGCSEQREAPLPGAGDRGDNQSAKAASDLQESEFRRFLDANYAQDMAQKPRTATRRGIRDNNREWNPYSEAFYEKQRSQWEDRLEELRNFDPAELSDAEALSWRLYEQELERDLASDAFRHHKYIIHQHSGAHMRVPTFLANMHRIDSVQDAEDYIARLDAVDTLFDQIIEQLEIRTEKGLYLPDWSYPQMVSTARNVIRGAPFAGEGDSDIWADFRRKLSALDLDDAERSRLENAARVALLKGVGPAYEKLIAAFEAQGALAPAEDGVWKFPDGDAFYAERLAYFTTTDLTPGQIHQIGLDNVARVHEEMRSIMATVGFEGDLREFMQFMREDDRFYYDNDAEGRARYLREARAIIDEMRGHLPEAFGLFPEAKLVVKRVEPFRERSAGKAFYQSPPADGSRPGIYYANLYDMRSMPVYQMEGLAYHEGIPGHHMQRAISIELEGVPEFQKYASFTAYTEGWGLYSEQLPKEMGFYTDPYSDFGRLAMELWRAARLVVDTGLHHKRWSREEAIEYLVENTPNARYDATKAIERYTVKPGQATAYMIGKLKILELREGARQALGEDFDIRGFHDGVLRDGPVPLSILEDKIEGWIARNQG